MWDEGWHPEPIQNLELNGRAQTPLEHERRGLCGWVRTAFLSTEEAVVDEKGPRANLTGSGGALWWDPK